MNGNIRSTPSSNCLNSGKLLSSFNAAKPNIYVLKCASNGKESKLAVMLSNCTVQIYEPDGFLSSCALVHEKEVTDVKFSNQDPHMLYSSSLDGKLKVWDIRCQEPAQTFLDASDGILKPLTCFDYNLDELYVCAGTELIREDAFLLFWDRRSSELLGGYWNSHTDDLTQIHFHPTENSGMASSSVDGLINIFNLNETSEDDALCHTLNVRAGIAKFCWTNSEHLACATSLEEYQFWTITEASPSVCISREELSRNYQLPVDYFIDNLRIEKLWYSATGTHSGEVHLWSYEKDGLNPTYSLLQGHSDVVRTISYDYKKKTIITGGEDGVVCNWKLPAL